ncbi:MAG: hypothetical protein R2748_06700 [Bryobacterales bacterium]
MQRLQQRSCAADGHDVGVVFQARPADALSLDEVDGELDVHRDFERIADHLAVALAGVAVAEEEQGAGLRTQAA